MPRVPPPARPKGAPKTPGSGRKKGTPNKTTQLLKDAVLKAAALRGEQIGSPKGTTGLEKYLVWLSKEHPQAFSSLLGRVLPMQVGGTSDDGDDIHINIVFE